MEPCDKTNAMADFPTLALRDGSLQLAVLEQKVDRWIAESQ